MRWQVTGGRCEVAVGREEFTVSADLIFAFIRRAAVQHLLVVESKIASLEHAHHHLARLEKLGAYGRRA